MPLPNITPRRGWKSCNALTNQNSPSNAKLRVPHYKSSSCKKKKKLKTVNLDALNITEKRDSNGNLWKKLAKVQKLDLQQNLSRKHYKTASAIIYTNDDKINILPITEQRGP